MSRPLVYLAGPITGLNYRGATDWREEVERELLPAIVSLTPMRGKKYLEALPVITDARAQQGSLATDPYGFKQVMSSPKGITDRDRNDVRRSDAILMNLLGSERISVGTMIEAGWADAYRKPVILVREDDNMHRHGMLDTIATYAIDNLEEALHLTRVLLLPH